MTRQIAKRIQADWPLNLSFDKSDSDIVDFYSSIKGRIATKHSIFHEKRQIDIFLLAMAIGVEQDNREKLRSPSNSIRRDALTEKETWMMCSVALATNPQLDILANSEELIRICQEYANGGIKTLMAWEKSARDITDAYAKSLTDMTDKMTSS